MLGVYVCVIFLMVFVVNVKCLVIQCVMDISTTMALCSNNNLKCSTKIYAIALYLFHICTAVQRNSSLAIHQLIRTNAMSGAFDCVNWPMDHDGMHFHSYA